MKKISKTTIIIIILSIIVITLTVLLLCGAFNYVKVEDKEVIINADETFKLNVKTNYDSLDYSVDDDNIASIDSNGNIIGINPGKTKINIKSKKEDITIEITVNYFESIEIYKGENKEIFSESLIDEISKTDNSNENAVKLEDNIIYGLSEDNEVKIVLTLKSGILYQYQVKVIKIPLEDIKFESEEIKMYKGDSLELDYDLIPENATCVPEFSIPDSIAVYSENTITALELGETNLKVVCDDFEKEIPIKIEERIFATAIKNKDESIKKGNKVDYKILYMEKSKTYDLDYDIVPSNTSDLSLSVISSNNNVSVSGTRLIANEVGDSYITVTSNSNTELTEKIKVFVLPSSVMNAKTYTEITYIKTIDLDSKNCIYKIKGDSYAGNFQSMSITDKYFILNVIGHGNTNGVIKIVDRTSGKKLKEFKISGGLNHANGSTYNPITKVHHVAISGDGFKNYKMNNIPDKIEYINHDMHNYATGKVSYDTKLNSYYLGLGGKTKMFMLDENLKELVTYNRLRVTNQDFLGKNGVIYCIHHGNGSDKTKRNMVDMYRINDGKYIGSMRITYKKEIEDMEVFDESTFSLLFIGGSNTGEICNTKDILSFD